MSSIVRIGVASDANSLQPQPQNSSSLACLCSAKRLSCKAKWTLREGMHLKPFLMRRKARSETMNRGATMACRWSQRRASPFFMPVGRVLDWRYLGQGLSRGSKSASCVVACGSLFGRCSGPSRQVRRSHLQSPLPSAQSFNVFGSFFVGYSTGIRVGV